MLERLSWEFLLGVSNGVGVANQLKLSSEGLPDTRG